MKPPTASSPATPTAMAAQRRSVNLSRKHHNTPMPRPRSSLFSARKLRSAAFRLTPQYDSSTGSSTRLVKISTATPMLAVTARSWITGMSISINTANPTASASNAVRPARNNRRKV
ncbi:hypothetical protein D3C71_1174070 [compost metagenome]